MTETITIAHDTLRVTFKDIIVYRQWAYPNSDKIQNKLTDTLNMLHNGHRFTVEPELEQSGDIYLVIDLGECGFVCRSIEYGHITAT